MGYTCTREPDGRYRVHDVEVFASHRRAFGSRELEVDRAWLDTALEAHRRRRAEGYEPPLTVNGGLHASASRGGRAVNAGTYELTRVELGSYDGEPVEILYADLIVSEETKDEIERGGLPYRSCESLDPFERPEIDAIALLDVDTPYFRFPVLRLDGQEAAVVATASGSAAMAWAARPQSMPDNTEEALMDGETKEDDAAMASGAAGGTIEDAQAKAAEAGDMVATVLADIAAKLEEVLGMLGGKATETEAEPEEIPDATEDDGAMPPVDDGAPIVASAAGSPALAQLQGRLEALERKNAALEQEKVIASAVDETLQDLARYGWTPADRDVLMAQAREGGTQALAAYAAGVKQAGELPPAWGTQQVDTRQQEPAAIAAYSALGPAGLARARQHAARYHGYGNRAVPLGDLDTYVRSMMRADGYDVDQVAAAAGK